ncbi:CotY/CotZ family spore coat protein [Neobacillus sp. PS3-40]|uniref:CotY/CotZ family spore coat protein n=1 Tax=Neobacillus sp. PS3-40 TaxID=3070679 RepID=UPI0027E0BE47|nr:CotY/CotZ family spore coat protein [Neobacillus sp. PS3-40]WML43402.1 CotY/CotZ family spore coat protein [Neobacillus sp. PS3-40]
MACGHKVSHKDQCVCTVLRAIADAQDQVSPVTSGCDISCERSIQELLSGVSPATTAPNTIPVILYCGCDPFLGTGVAIVDNKFECVETFIFRVTSVDGNCCAVIELLEIAGAHGCPTSPCDQLGGINISHLKRTGICITIDLNCFCAITCLEPVTL